MEVISLASLLSMNTAKCERGFSLMHHIISSGRSRLTTHSVNSLMNISIDGNTVKKFDSQTAATFWSKEATHCPANRKVITQNIILILNLIEWSTDFKDEDNENKHTESDSSELSTTEMDLDTNNV